MSARTWWDAIRGVRPRDGAAVLVGASLDAARAGRLLRWRAATCDVEYASGGVGIIPHADVAWWLADVDERPVALAHAARRCGFPERAIDQGVRFYFDPFPSAGDEPAWVLEAGVDLAFKYEAGGMDAWSRLFHLDEAGTDTHAETRWLALALALRELEGERTRAAVPG